MRKLSAILDMPLKKKLRNKFGPSYGKRLPKDCPLKLKRQFGLRLQRNPKRKQMKNFHFNGGQMTREENAAQLNRLAEKLEDGRTATRRYVPVVDPAQGEVVLEEMDPDEEDLNK